MFKDLTCGVIMLLLAGVYIVAANNLPRSALSDAVGASGFPLLIGWSLLILSLLLIGQALLSSRQEAVKATDTGDDIVIDAVWENPRRTLTGAAVLVTIAAGFLLALPILGYLLSMALLIGITASYISRAAGRQQLAVAVGGAVGLYVLFVLVLGISMPAGLFEGLLP